MEAVRSIDLFLGRVACGERELLPTLLSRLAEQVVYAPFSIIVDVGDGLGTQKAKTITLSDNGLRSIPAFTSEEFLNEWAGETAYECLPFSGADLALIVPSGTGITFNPGRRDAVRLSPVEVQQLASIEPTLLCEPEQREGELPTAEDLASDEILVADEVIADAGQDLPSRAQEAAPLDLVILRDLTELLAQYPEVKEAYFLETHEEYSEAILGLLTDGLSVERRFVIITEIGEIARAYYGYAGAIECYTDLHAPHTSSWELFKLLNPFYLSSADETEGFDTTYKKGSSEIITPTPDDEVDSGQTKPFIWRVLKRPRFPFFRTA